MRSVEKLSVALTTEMVTDVRNAVNSGDYASNSEVIRDALREWKRKRAMREQETEMLRSLWNEGIERGSGQYGSMDEIKQAARARLSKPPSRMATGQ